jgi:predicted SprT family Zn-dependent metalloprotease
MKFKKPNFDFEWDEALRYPEFEDMGKEGWINFAKDGHIMKYSEIKDVLSNVDLGFDTLEEPKKERFKKSIKLGKMELPIVVKFSDEDYDLIAGNTRLSGLVSKGVDSPLWVVDLSKTNSEEETNEIIKESLVMESNYNGIVRQIVKDITEVFKMDRTGSFNLPEDLRESELYYDYPQFKKEFEVSVNFEQSDDVDTFEVDGDLYYDDDNIEILVITNPNSGNEIINDLIRELNEVVRHELEHIKQYDKGMRRKKEPQDPEKYYSQNHEIDAQRAGFKRRSKQEKTGMESLVRDWFKKYPHKHNLTPEQQERVIQKILSEK